MAKHIALLSCILAVLTGCEEKITAPGSCPEYCKETSFEVRDTVIVDAIVADTSFRGYVFSHRAALVQTMTDPAGPQARTLFEFVRFLPEVPLFSSDTTFGNVVSIDSFVVEIAVARRRSGNTGTALNLYATPPGFDSATTFSDLDSSFQVSNLITQIPVPDTLENGTLSVTLAPGSFGPDELDSLTVSFGAQLEGAGPDWLYFGASGSLPMITVRRYFKADSSGTTVDRDDARSQAFARTVPNFGFSDDPDLLSVGGLPSSRIVLRVTGIDDILANSSIVRATVELTPEEPAIAAPDDSLRVQANPVGVDFGKKSPIIATQIDSLQRGTGRLPSGSTDVLELDVTQMLNAWANNEDLPRTMVISALPEASSVGAAVFFSSRTASRPRLRITFVPPVGLSN